MPRKVFLCALLLLNLFIGWLYLRPLRPIDFMAFYMAGRLVSDGRVSELYHKSSYDPYLAELRRAGEPIYSPYFNRPAFESPLFVPLTWFPYLTAAALMKFANLLLLAVLVWKLPFWFHAPPSVRVCLFIFMPFLVSMARPQDTLLLTLLAAYGLKLALDGHDVSAGILLAACAFKPHLIWAMPMALAAAKKWKMLSSFLTTGFALAAVSVAMVGLTGMRDWINLLRAPTTDMVPWLMTNTRVIGIYFGSAAGALAAVLTFGSFLYILVRGSFQEKLSGAIFTSLLLSPHTYIQDYSLLAIVAMFAASPIARYLLLLPWPYFYSGQDYVPLVLLSILYISGMALALFFRSRAKEKCSANSWLPLRPICSQPSVSSQSDAVTGIAGG